MPNSISKLQLANAMQPTHVAQHICNLAQRSAEAAKGRSLGATTATEAETWRIGRGGGL